MLKVKTGGAFTTVGGSSEPADDWVRPSDWLTLPTLTAGQHKFVGLVAVFDAGSNWVSLSSTTALTVSWGDGTANENLAGGVVAHHNYAYSAVSGTDSTRGYRQAVVTVTPQSGNLNSISLVPTRQTGLASGYSSLWLDVAVVGANITSLQISSGTTKASLLEQFEYVGPSSLTSSVPVFTSAVSLQSVKGTQWTAGLVSFVAMFSSATSLRTVPLFDTGNATTLSQMFNGCYSLREVPLFDTVKVTGAGFGSMFVNCYALRSVPLFNTALATSFSNMFLGCSSLQSAPTFNAAAVTSFNSMFQNCSALQVAPAFNTAAALSFNDTFNGCVSLQSVPAWNVAAATSFSAMFTGCPSLQSAPLAGARFAISYASCKLSGSALDAIYTGLGTASGAQTITVTSNIGTATDTPSIATGKGWTVTG
jgi:hypothetical protein